MTQIIYYYFINYFILSVGSDGRTLPFRVPNAQLPGSSHHLSCGRALPAYPAAPAILYDLYELVSSLLRRVHYHFPFYAIPLRLDLLLLCGKPILTRPVTPLISSLSALGRCDNCLLIFPLVRIRQILRDLLMLTCAFAACWRYCMGNHHHRGSPVFFATTRPASSLIGRSAVIALQLYSAVGGIFLFKYGPFLFFVYPEWYGIVSML